MTATRTVQRTTVPRAVGENRERVRVLENARPLATHAICIYRPADAVVADAIAFFFPLDPDLAGRTLLRAEAGVYAASSSGDIEIQITNATQSIDLLTTPITIVAGEDASYGAGSSATPSVPDDTVICDEADKIVVNVVSAGTDATGLCVLLYW